MIVSVLFLIGLFLCISGYLILTGLNFIGLAYLLVYIGAVKNRKVRSLRSKWAAWVRIPLYKVLLIIKNFLFKTMFYKNKLPSLKFKRVKKKIKTKIFLHIIKDPLYLDFIFIFFFYTVSLRLIFFSSYFEFSKLRRKKIKQRKSHFSQKSFSNHSEEFIK